MIRLTQMSGLTSEQFYDLIDAESDAAFEELRVESKAGGKLGETDRLVFRCGYGKGVQAMLESIKAEAAARKGGTK